MRALGPQHCPLMLVTAAPSIPRYSLFFDVAGNDERRACQRAFRPRIIIARPALNGHFGVSSFKGGRDAKACAVTHDNCGYMALLLRLPRVPAPNRVVR